MSSVCDSDVILNTKQSKAEQSKKEKKRKKKRGIIILFFVCHEKVFVSLRVGD